MNGPGDFASSVPSPNRKRCSSTFHTIATARDVQPAPGRIRRVRRDLPLEGLPREGAHPLQDMTLQTSEFMLRFLHAQPDRRL